MIPIEEIDTIIKHHQNPGYSSLYMYEEKDAEQIVRAKHSGGMGDYTPASDYLAIDIDSIDGVDLEKAEAALKGFKYEKWFSGKKGYHLILPHKLIHDKRLPYSHMRVVEGLGIKADMCLYQPGRIFRLPGCVHESSRARKILLGRYDGVEIDIPLVEKPSPVFAFQEAEDYKGALGALWSFAEQGVSNGERNNKFWQIASKLINAGFDPDSVRGFLSVVNENQKEPLDEVELNLTINSAAKKVRL
jgi:hypothetical protein